MEKVSVIIPTYNRCSTIEKSIRSVLEQTYSNIEVIVVDDGSVDNTEDTVKEIHDKRIKYYKKENGGAASARNEGVRYANANIIAFHDSDDCWRMDKLEKQMKYWKEHPEYSMIYSRYMAHTKDGRCFRVPTEDKLDELEGWIFRTLLIQNTIGTPTMLIKKEIFEELGGFDISLLCLEDWEFALRFAKQYQIGLVDEVLVDAYQMDEGVSANIVLNYEVNCRIISKYRNELLEYGLFNRIVGKLFASAEKYGVLEQVKRMLMMYLQL